MQDAHGTKTWTLDRGQVKNKDGWVIASFPYTIGGKEDHENARLALNAPEMFALLQEAMEVFQDSDTNPRDSDWARKEDLLHDIAMLLDEIKTIPECSHKPERLHSWTALDGTLCVGCCDCGKVLQGGVE